jgi:hypothetical protein
MKLLDEAQRLFSSKDELSLNVSFILYIHRE